TAGNFVDHQFAGAPAGFYADIPAGIMKGIRMLLHPWFIILFLLFSGHQIAQKLLELKHVLLDSYLDPLLLMPLLLHLVLWERRYLFNKGQSYTLPLKDIIILLVIVSVLSEYALPLWSSAFTA